MSIEATRLKEEGNRHFQQKDYVGAEGLYSKAIIADPKEPALYTNRALARIKLDMWDSAVADCNECITLKPDNMKAYYYLSQAQLALRDYDAALKNVLKAHELCSKSADKSLTAVTAQVLQIKGERWEELERKRIREGTELEAEALDLMQKERDRMLETADEGEKKDIEVEWEQKMESMKSVFERARAADSKHRKVPDWAVDDIGFNIMVDPVITKRGKSYERSSIMEHLRNHPTDPLTREALYPSDLIPNLGLKQACEEFLEENGWAVDW